MHRTIEGITLRSATAHDAPILCRWWNDGRVMAHAGFPNGLGTTAQAIESSLAGDSDETFRRLILEEGGRPIGEMSFRRIDPATAEIGIKICESARQEKGIGTKALKMLIEYLFETGCQTIVLDTNLKNERAQHVYEKLGFERVGVRIDAWIDQVGVPQSAVDYRLTKAEYPLT